MALVVFVWPGAESGLVDNRAAVLRGELWRLWTGHWVHFGASHLWWNLAVFVPAGGWAECLAPGRARLLLALAPGAISVVLLAVEPALVRYGGLSGLATAMLALLALTQLASARTNRWLWRGVLALITMKIAIEFLARQPMFAHFTDPGIHAVPLAHLAGLACAMAAHFIRRPRQI